MVAQLRQLQWQSVLVGYLVGVGVTAAFFLRADPPRQTALVVGAPLQAASPDAGACANAMSDVQILAKVEAASRAQYRAEYFAWQSRDTARGGEISALLFKPYIRNADVVADFGCGSGTVINSVDAKERWCIEANPFARNFSASHFPDMHTFENVEDLPNNTFDVIMSNHALEHTPCPLVTIAKLLSKLKEGGKAVFAVPSLEIELAASLPGGEWDSTDIHHHLQVWAPQQLGNLFRVAGYEILEARTARYSRTGSTDAAWDRGGAEEFWRVAREENRHPQTMVIARRPASLA